MSPVGSDHIASCNALTHLLVLAIGDRGIVSVGNPVRLTRRSEPQPDFAVLKPREGYRQSIPRPEDTMLAIEVANTGLDYDRTIKLALYAKSGIPEVWIVNLLARDVEVYRVPSADGYASCTRAGPADTLSMAAMPGVVIPVAKIFAWRAVSVTCCVNSEWGSWRLAADARSAAGGWNQTACGLGSGCPN